MNEFLVGFLETVFDTVSKISYFHWLKTALLKWRPTWWGPGVVELYVLAALTLAFMSLWLGPLSICLIFFVAFRLWEILVYQVNVFLFDPFRIGSQNEAYKLHSYRRFLVLYLMNYIEILLWFSAIYMLLSENFKTGSESVLTLTEWNNALYYSVVTMTTLGYGDITPTSSLTQSLATLQTLIGILFVILILSRLVNMLPRPGTKDPDERDPLQ